MKNSIENFIEPAALKSSFELIQDSTSVTLSCDHFTEHRHKFQTQNVICYKKDTETGKKIVKYIALGLCDVFDTSGASTCEKLKQIFRLGAVLTAKSADANALELKLQETLGKIKFSITDGASNMINAIELFEQWRKEHCLDMDVGELVWIHCNAHLVPAFDSGIEKILIKVEGMLQIEPHVVKQFNKTFFKVSDSITYTMLRAIFLMVGTSSKNNTWSCMVQFNTFLSQNGKKKIL